MTKFRRNAPDKASQGEGRRALAASGRQGAIQRAGAPCPSEGPQHVTVHGRDEVVVIAADEFRRLKGERTGAALVEAMQASPWRDIDIEPARAPSPVRDVTL